MDVELRNLVAEFDRVVALWCADPEQHGAAAYVTRVLAARPEWMRLVAQWRAASDDPVAARRLAWVLAEQGGRRGSQRALERAAELGDRPALAALARAGGRAARARYEQAADDVADDSAEAALTTGLRNATADALPWFARADELGSAEGAAQLGRVQMELGELERAEETLRRAVDRGSTSAPLWLVTTLVRREDRAGAERVHRQAVERGLPGHEELAACLAGSAARIPRQAAAPDPVAADDPRRPRPGARRRS
jgi:tetratricopeptide (TPR) repeat protein